MTPVRVLVIAAVLGIAAIAWIVQPDQAVPVDPATVRSPDVAAAAPTPTPSDAPRRETASGSPRPFANRAEPPDGITVQYRITEQGAPDATRVVAIKFGRPWLTQKGWRQRVDTVTGSSSGQDAEIRTWRSNGVYIDQTLRTEGTHASSCTYRKPLLALRFPLKVGGSWRIDDASTCREPSAPEGRHTMSFTVSGIESVRVGSREVRTFVIRRTAVLRRVDAGVVRTDERSWFSPEYGIKIRSTWTVTTTETSGETKRSYESTLVRLP